MLALSNRRPRVALAIALLAAVASPPLAVFAKQAAAGADRTALGAAVALPARTPANVARDPYRHPVDTLAFFGVRPTDTVVEIWPGGGWYTEILAPYLAAKGTLYAAGLGADGGKLKDRLTARDAARYGALRVASFPAQADEVRVPDGTADVVLTFRNVHNWRMGYKRGGQDYSAEAFRQMFAMLKRGGVLGIEDHRLPEGRDAAAERTSGYLKRSTVVALATAAGFRLAGESEINANPKDTADHPEGVWTLPPTYQLKDVDRAKYAAIGESDRMTLKFVKP